MRRMRCKHLRCGDLGMLRQIGYRLLYMSARTCVRYLRRDKNCRFDSTYTWRDWLGVWGSLRFPVDRNSRTLYRRVQQSYVAQQEAVRNN